MSLSHLPSDAFTSIFQHMNDEQVGRLFGTGNKLIQYRILHTRRRCSLSYCNTRTDLVAKLLTTATDVTSDEAFLAHLFTLEEMPTNLRSFTLETSTSGEREFGPFDLRGLVNLHTFSCGERFREYSFVLPSSLTDLTICVSSIGGYPITQALEDLCDLAKLDISFNHESFERLFFDHVIVWPESLTSLAYEMASDNSLSYLDKLPSTLNHLKLSSPKFNVCIPLTVPRQCTSLTSLNIVGRHTPLPPDVWMPPSLTHIRASLSPGLGDIATFLGSIPTHVENLAFDGLGGVILNDVLAIGRMLLPRLSLEQLHLMTAHCSRFLTSKKDLARPLFRAAFLKFALGKSYLSTILELERHHGTSRYRRLYEFNLPRHYLDAYLSSPFGRRTMRMYAVAIDDIIRQVDWRDHVEWAFSRAGARQLHLGLEYLPDNANPSLPAGASANVEELRLVLTSAAYLSSLLSSPLPRLETLAFTDMHDASPSLINDLVEVVYDFRRFLPRLVRIAYGRLDGLTHESVRMLAEMKLYEGECIGVFGFYASPPRRTLQKYPYLRPRPVEVE